jgi:hypothetical protein
VTLALALIVLVLVAGIIDSFLEWPDARGPHRWR